jgi:SAM-dependent methyltransferase
MDWIDGWPPKFQPILQLLAKNFKYDAVWLKRELSGASGAKTYLAEPQGAAGRGTPFIVKLGEKIILDQDLAGLQFAKQYFHSANYSLEYGVELDGIRCIPMEIAGGNSSLPFNEFYAQTNSPETVSDLIKQLFRKVLRRGKLSAQPTHENVFSLYRFDDIEAMSRQLRKVDNALPTFASWWERCRSKFAQKSYTTLSHGDLHSGNVRIDGEKPYVIDFGRTGNNHVMQDLAKFEREIRLFLLPQNKEEIEDLLAELEIALHLPANDVRRTSQPEIHKACVAIEALRGLARESLRPQDDWEFEYRGALLAQFIFAAGNSKLKLPQRRAALSFAGGLRKWFEERLGNSIFDSSEILAERRKAALWRIAYVFLRLDQLPSGGWSKPMAQWMEAIWENDDGEIPRNPDMRVKGGTDLTSYAFHHYLGFLDTHLSPSDRTRLIFHNQVAQRVRRNLRDKIVEGGIEPVKANTPTRVRHTLMALIAFLRYGKANNLTLLSSDEIAITVKYLSEHLRDWQKDKSHFWGMYSALVKLEEMLQQGDYARQIKTKANRRELDRLVKKISDVREPMSNALGETNCEPRPEGTFPPYDAIPFFKPYFNFWRMERSNFLMYLPYLISDDGKKFLDSSLRNRCAQCIEQLLDEISAPFETENPTASLLPYHRPHPSGHISQLGPRDWGLSAEFAAVLELPAVRELLNAEHEEKQRALRSALLQTFDGYYLYPQIFKFTHGVSFGRYLGLVPSSSLALDEIKPLDEVVTRLCSEGITEDDVSGLLSQVLRQSGDPTDIDTRALTDMMVNKLESGDHTPDGEVCRDDIWRTRVDGVVSTTTITFYNGSGGADYANRYIQKPILPFVSRIKHTDCQGRKALDVGCGPGQYAKLLKDEGYEVEIVDMSEEMLKMASEQLGLPTPPPPKNIYRLSQYFESEAFDLIFACAMMVHVPWRLAGDIYRDFYYLLKPDGLLFVNFKLGDHSLISLGGRYFQYYRDSARPMKMLQEAGFMIEEVETRWNTRNLHNDPKGIRWANFYCKKPGS